MSDQTKISIVVPVYNAERTLRRCVEALLDQTYKNIEIILVNDASSDGSFDIMQEYETLDTRVIAVDNLHGGVSHTRNTGIHRASGEYIMFCDSDDYVEPKWCETLFNQIFSNDAVLGMCGVRVIKSNGDIRHRNVGDAKVLSISNFFELDKNGEFTYVVWDKIFKKECINEFFDKSFEFGEDALFVMHYLMQFPGDAKISIGSEALYNYDLGGMNRLSNKWCDSHHKFAREREKIAKLLAEKWLVDSTVLDRYILDKRNSLLVSDIYFLASPKTKLSFKEKYHEIKMSMKENKKQISKLAPTSMLIRIIKLRSPLLVIFACKFKNI